MKKYLFSLCLLLTGLSASAQSVSIRLTSGDELTFKSSEIKEINFKEETPTDDGVSHNGHEYVDLGLSVLWAKTNVGAETMIDYGEYFAWGETESKSEYNSDSYKYYASSSETSTDSQGLEITNKYTGYTKYVSKSNSGTYGFKGFYDDKKELDAEDDGAFMKWGGNWRIPTSTEIAELRNKCTWTWATINGINGYKVTSKVEGYTNKYIFLPAAGYCAPKLNYYTHDGNYMSATLSGKYVLNLYFNSTSHDRTDYCSRYYGFSIRPVLSK